MFIDDKTDSDNDSADFNDGAIVRERFNEFVSKSITVLYFSFMYVLTYSQYCFVFQ
jgi:hypothetical protein